MSKNDKKHGRRLLRNQFPLCQKLTISERGKLSAALGQPRRPLFPAFGPSATLFRGLSFLDPSSPSAHLGLPSSQPYPRGHIRICQCPPCHGVAYPQHIKKFMELIHTSCSNEHDILRLLNMCVNMRSPYKANYA